MLDSNVGSTSYTDMIRWMERDVKALGARPPGTTQWLIALVHAAPYSKGSEDCDTHKDQRCVSRARGEGEHLSTMLMLTRRRAGPLRSKCLD